MRRRILLSTTVAAAALALAGTALPAVAATPPAPSFKVAGASGAVAVDGSRLWVAQRSPAGALSVAAVDLGRRAVTVTVPLAAGASGGSTEPEAIQDLQVDPRTHRLWAAWNTGATSTVVGIAGRTPHVTDTWGQGGRITSLVVDPASGRAFTATSSVYLGHVHDSTGLVGTNTLQSAGTLVAFDAATHSSGGPSLPVPATTTGCGDYDTVVGKSLGADITLNTNDGRLLVSTVGVTAVYSSDLALITTAQSPFSACDRTSIAYNPSANVAHVLDGQRIVNLSSTTGAVQSATYSIPGPVAEPVMDPTRPVLYRSTAGISTEENVLLGRTRAPVRAVDPASHALYGAGDGRVLVMRPVG